MVNPSAARHLSLVVGVLLCFFVYMGYHIKNRQAVEPDSEHIGLETASAGSGSGATSNAADSFALMTSSESAPSGSAGSDNASVSMPSGLPLPIGSLDTSDLDVNPSDSGQLSLADGLIAMSDMDDENMPVPSGSFEEADNIITGFTTDMPTLALPGQSSESDTSALADGFVPSLPVAGEEGSAGDDITGLSVAGNSPPPAPAGSVESIVASQTTLANPISSLPPPPAANTAPQAVLTTPPAQQNFSAGADGQAPGNQSPPPVRPGTGAATVTPSGAGEQLRTYIVRPGDTLSSIAARELGSISLADNIYLMNRDVIFNPDYLLSGTTIKLPPTPSRYSEIADPIAQASGIRGGLGNTPPPPPSGGMPAPQRPFVPGIGERQNAGAPSADGVQRYRIRSGDTLSSIALQFYGSSSGWRFLYEANSAVLPNPNQLTIGTEIVIPLYGER
jgi:Uncharacterized protein containing LysM domain